LTVGGELFVPYLLSGPQFTVEGLELDPNNGARITFAERHEPIGPALLADLYCGAPDLE